MELAAQTKQHHLVFLSTESHKLLSDEHPGIFNFSCVHGLTEIKAYVKHDQTESTYFQTIVVNTWAFSRSHFHSQKSFFTATLLTWNTQMCTDVTNKMNSVLILSYYWELSVFTCEKGPRWNYPQFTCGLFLMGWYQILRVFFALLVIIARKGERMMTFCSIYTVPLIQPKYTVIASSQIKPIAAISVPSPWQKGLINVRLQATTDIKSWGFGTQFAAEYFNAAALLLPPTAWYCVFLPPNDYLPISAQSNRAYTQGT